MVHLGSGLENYSTESEREDVRVYIHESSGSMIAEYLVKDLKEQGLNVRVDDTKCLCSYKDDDLGLDGHRIVLLNTLNGILDGIKESMDCNKAVKEVILDNPETHFWLMDFGDGNFREWILGRPENLAYIRYKGLSTEDFMKEAYSLRR